ncbi:hypothetical protein JHK82_056620 [Glycine max]|nr:hypothetical protein JHK86_056455 [Glycine max]KAG4919179.1 hypothetical protein JHK85_057460 [Glycine max]KAG5077925.1 hypothetical protein JHK82_056620 [Glycine max]
MKCVKISKLTSGEIDCANLRNLVLAHKDKPAIINLNIGTTMKGAIDDLDLVIQTLEGCGFTRDRFYIHCDGALFGMMLPFVKQTLRITFKKPIGSVTISGHKFLGCPIPCGVVITHLEYTSMHCLKMLKLLLQEIPQSQVAVVSMLQYFFDHARVPAPTPSPPAIALSPSPSVADDLGFDWLQQILSSQSTYKF